jgi:hypothetical protein
MKRPVSGRDIGTMPARHPLFQAVGTRLTDGSVRFRVFSAAPIFVGLRDTVRQIEHPSFLSSFPGKTLQASFLREGRHTASGPGTIVNRYRQVPQWFVTHTPEQISKITFLL